MIHKEAQNWDSKGGKSGSSFGRWRRIVRIIHVILLPGIPFLKINGESALRFDIPELKLYFFGKTFWMDEFFIVLVATLFLTFLIVSVTIVFGRIWCGWLCPQTVISDLTVFFERSLRKGLIYRVSAYGGVFLLSIFIGANLIWYFVSPYEFFQRLMAWELGKVIWGFWIVLTLIIFLDFTLVRRRFCATVCPYAKMQSMLFDNRTLIIAFDNRRLEECMDCRACVQVCPVGIDIRKGANIACINCAECVDKCNEIFKKKGKKGIINYFWGEPGAQKKELLRPSAIITGALTFLSMFLLVYLTGTLRKIDITIIPDHNFQPRLTASNELINSFIISIENRKEAEERFLIKASGNLKVVPNQIDLKPGELKRTKVFLIGHVQEDRALLTFTPSAISTPQEKSITKEVTLIRP